MTTTTEVLSVALERERLLALVGELCEESKAPRPEGGPEAVVRPLLDQVDEEVRLARAGEGYRATTLSSRRSITSLAALDLLVEIDTTARVRPGTDRVAAVRSWAVRVGGTGSLGEVCDAADAAGRWVVTARGLLAPMRRTIGLRGAACPSCGAVTVVNDDGTGERTVEAAIQVDTATGQAACTAEGCEAWWSADLLPHLAAVLDQQGRETLTNR